jgi:rhodanese-related sulfurtransferase
MNAVAGTRLCAPIIFDMKQLSVLELKRILEEKPEGVQLVDVREPDEVAFAALPGFQNFPMSIYYGNEEALTEALDPHQPTVVLCHHGVRSLHMGSFLNQHGFTDLYNVEGGIDEYTLEADPSIPRY